MTTTFVNKLTIGLLVSLTLLFSFPSQANPVHPTPSRKEIRHEARSLKLRGKKLQQEGKEMIKESKALKDESGKRREARQLRKEGRRLIKIGKNMEQQGRLLRKGKISLYAIKDC